MPLESRTYKSIKNAQVNIFFYLLQIIIGFWSRKVFYDYLGSEVIGLDTAAASLFEFLNIAESGVGVAVAFFLYTPLFDNDTKTINKIVALQGWIYRRIATIILVLGIVLMGFFPWIFQDIKIPLWYAYATFSVILFGNLLGYYVNYKQSVLSADQKTYKVIEVTQIAAVALRAFLIIYLPFASNPFLLYMGTMILGYVFGSIWLNHVLKKEYPWLSSVKESGRELLREYPEVLNKTKQLFVHKIGGFVIFQCTPMLMYSFCSLTIIAYYGNYMTIIDKIKVLINQIFGSTQASVGNLIASKDNYRIMEVFWELIDSRLCISLIMLFTLMMITEPFISVWLSPTYLLGKPLLFLILLNAFLFINRGTVDGYKDGMGLFSDVWAPIAESAINLSVAIICGYIMGIEGVLLGGVASEVIISYMWRPYYTFKKGLKINYFTNFFKPYLYRVILVIASTALLYTLTSQYKFKPDGFLNVSIYALIIGGIAALYYFVLFTLLTSGMKDFNRRILSYINQKLS